MVIKLKFKFFLNKKLKFNNEILETILFIVVLFKSEL